MRMGVNESTMMDHSSNPGDNVSRLPFGEPRWVLTIDSPYHRKSHHELRRFLRSFLQSELFPHAQQWEVEGAIPEQFYKKLAYKGLIMPSLPRQFRGGHPLPAHIPDEEWDLFHTLIVHEELARSPANGPIWGLTSGNSLACPLILQFGNTRHHDQFLPAVHRGESRLCLAVTEPEAGTDITGIKTTAVTDKSDLFYFTVNGTKRLIAGGVWADYAVTLVQTTDRQSKPGLTLLVIALRTHAGDAAPGVTIEKIGMSGLNAAGCATITFKDVRVSRANLLGREGGALEMLRGTYNLERMRLSVSGLTMARTCLREALAHALKRKTFGKALIENQIIRAKFAGMIRALETNYAWYERTVWDIEQAARVLPNGAHGRKDYVAALFDPHLGAQVAFLKVQTSKTLEFLSSEALQILGGSGMTREPHVGVLEQISRDMRAWAIGGEEILDDVAVQMVLSRSAKESERPRAKL